MMNAKVDKGEVTLSMSGTITQMLTDYTIMTKAVHNCLEEKGHGDLFKKYVTDILPLLAFGDDDEIKKKFWELLNNE